MSFEVGQKVLVTIDGTDSEWELVARFESGAVRLERSHGEDCLSLYLPHSLVRPLPMEEPQQLGAVVDTDHGRALRTNDGHTPPRYAPTWLLVDADPTTYRLVPWDKLSSPRPYKGEQA